MQIAQELRRRLSGIPGVIVRAQPGGGNFQLNQMLGGGQDARARRSRSAATTSTTRRRIQQQAIGLMQDTPGHRRRRALGRTRGGRSSRSASIAPKAAMLGLTVNGVAKTIQTNVAGTKAAQFRERGNEYPIVVRLREEDREQVADIGDVLVSTPRRPGRAGPEPARRRPRNRAGADRSQEHGADRSA